MTKGMNFINLYQNEYSFEEKINENFMKIDNFLTLSVEKKIKSLKQQEIEENLLYLIDNDNENNELLDKINQIACYNENHGWFFYSPKEGDILFLKNEKKFYYYTTNNDWKKIESELYNLNNLITNKHLARQNLEVYSKDEVDTKINNIPSSSRTPSSTIDVSTLILKKNNLSDLADKETSRQNLDVYSKDEVKRLVIARASKIDILDDFVFAKNNLSELTDKSIARQNLEVYSKDETDKKIKDAKIDTSTLLLCDNNLNDLKNKDLARSVLNVYSKNDIYNKKEIDRKIVDLQIKGMDTSLVVLTNNNLSDLNNKDEARQNLEVYSKDEIDKENISFLKKKNNLLDIEDKKAACANLNVYSKEETFDRKKNLLDILDQDAACHNLGTLRDWEIHRIGDYKFSAVRTDHDNWLICDGREISRLIYSKLFELIGTECGEGDGKSTFNLPDFRNKTMWGANGNLNSTLSSGLPNIYGRQNGGVTIGEKQDGAIYSPPNSVYCVSVTAKGGLTESDGFSFDASKCNPIYGKTDIVQPPAICVNVFIKAK